MAQAKASKAKRAEPFQAVEVPLLVDARDLPAGEAALSQARAAVETLEGQMSALAAQAFFDAHPEALRATLRGDWEADGQGGSDFSLWAELDLAEGFELPVDGEGSDWDARMLLSRELTDGLERHGSQLDGLVLSRSDALREVGELLLGEGAHGAWRAEVERREIAGCARPAKKASKSRARV